MEDQTQFVVLGLFAGSLPKRSSPRCLRHEPCWFSRQDDEVRTSAQLYRRVERWDGSSVRPYGTQHRRKPALISTQSSVVIAWTDSLRRYRLLATPPDATTPPNRAGSSPSLVCSLAMTLRVC